MRGRIAIIGSGPAGLAAALTLSRSMVDNFVLQGKSAARNAASPFVAALPGMDRNAPKDVREAVQRDIEHYPYTQFVAEDVEDIAVDKEVFRLVLTSGTELQAETVLLATGMCDLFPSLAGLSDFWGNSVINCPFCHGYEWKDRRWGIYAHRPEVIEAAEIYRNWTADLTYFVDPLINLSQEHKQKFETMGIAVEHALPVALEGENGTLRNAELPDGRVVQLDCMLIFPHQRQVELISRLPLETANDGYVVVDEGFRTSMPGVYAAGDLTYAGHQNTPTAFHMGNMAAATILMDRCFKK